MATTIITKYGSGAPAASDVVRGELAVDTENKRLYTEDSGGSVVELGTNPAANVTFGDNVKAVFGAGSDLEILSNGTDGLIRNGNATGEIRMESDDRIIFADRGFNEVFAVFNDDDDVKLYHDGNQKLATTSTGIDVTGTVTADGLTVESSGDPTSITLRHTGNTSGFVIKNFSGAESQLVNVDNGPMVFKTNDTEAMRIDASQNVGIGTSSPTSGRLQVKGSGSTVSTNAIFAENSSGAGTFAIRDNGDAFILGNTGIGTSSPSFTAGNAGIHIADATSPAIRLQDSNAANSDYTIYSPSSDNTLRIYHENTASDLVTFASSGNVGIGVTPASYTNYNTLAHSGSTGATFEQRVGSTLRGSLTTDSQVTLNAVTAVPLVFKTTNTERMRIDSSGNVGLKNSSPSSYSGDGADLVIGTTSGDNGLSIISGTSGTGNIYFGDVQETGTGSRRGQIVYDHATDHMRFATAATERMRIDSSGNVLIGNSTYGANLGQLRVVNDATSAPASLSLMGYGNITDSAEAGKLEFALQQSGTGGQVHAKISGLASGTSEDEGQLAFYTSNNTLTERMRIDEDGNLLIGTTDTTAFDGTTGINIGGNRNALAFSSTGNNQMLIYSKTTGLQFYDSTNNADRMLLDNSGNLLVGDTSANARIYGAISSASLPAGAFVNTNAGTSGVGAIITSVPSTANNTNCFHLKSTTQGVASYFLYGDGSSSFTSDERQKKNIVTTRDGYLDDLKNLRVVDYHWNNQENTEDKNIGLIAQEVEQVFPHLIVEHELEGAGVRKNLKGSDFTFILIKAIQEQQDLIESLTARIAALEGAN
jgi:hypothetical protein